MAIVPEVASRLAKTGVEVVVESGAGLAARFSDDAYREAGATVAPARLDALSGAADRGPGPASDRRGGRRPAPRGVS